MTTHINIKKTQIEKKKKKDKMVSFAHQLTKSSLLEKETFGYNLNV